ncbi:LacI family DNA-binding transcriptional regulator [Vineibacter terrae]|uniref:LacI family DNA-binding transcriptional regulator n=1 Tax=Vineibacter terrae TaxID=2586908 RepID=UPI002E366535|nr:LacI family DNA-binding transcriptional regulator [Vineibacter terrae]HEX2890710.1 LacI family DNA-binding transcriptional regulator [Vineibacter terrae]
MVDVAKAAGVSLATVSAAVNGSAPVSAALKGRIHKAIKQVGYKTNAIARSLKTGTTSTIGLMVADITNPFFTTTIHAIQELAHRHGYGVMLCCSDEDADKERMHLRLLADRMVDGFIVASAGETPELRALVEGGRTPVVLIDRLVDGLETDAVVIDNVAATRDAVRHLAAAGHRRIGLITGRRTLSTGRERYEGYRLALEEAGIAFEPALVGSARFGADDGYKAAAKLVSLADRPTAIFACNNLSGIGLMRAIHDAGLRCPDDIAVACFDDFDWANVFHPRLTTVAQPTQAIGVQAMLLLLERLKDATARALPPRVVRLKAELRVRDSSVRPVR